MRIWAKISKTGPAIFISHLDLLRTIERSLRRAKIPISMTEGYRPRPKLAFGPALPLGMGSDGEYIDIELMEDMDISDFISKIQNALPPGLQVLDACQIPSHFKSLNALIDTASYNVKGRHSPTAPTMVLDIINNDIASFLERSQILITREGKNGMKEVNISGLINEVQLLKIEPESLLLEMLLAVGARGSVRPDEVITVLSAEIELFRMDITSIHRNELFITIQDGRKISPMEYSRIF